jgi:hypothetical protein
MGRILRDDKKTRGGSTSRRGQTDFGSIGRRYGSLSLSPPPTSCVAPTCPPPAHLAGCRVQLVREQPQGIFYRFLSPNSPALRRLGGLAAGPFAAVSKAVRCRGLACCPSRLCFVLYHFEGQQRPRRAPRTIAGPAPGAHRTRATVTQAPGADRGRQSRTRHGQGQRGHERTC